jgi:hypothetical protein
MQVSFFLPKQKTVKVLLLLIMTRYICVFIEMRMESFNLLPKKKLFEMGFDIVHGYIRKTFWTRSVFHIIKSN